MSLRLILLIVAISSLACSYITHRLTDSAWQSQWDAHMLQDADALMAANQVIRDREQRIVTLQSEAEENAKTLRDTHAVELTAANDAAQRLRDKLQQFTERAAAANSSTVAERAAAATDRLVLVELLKRADSRAGELADFADRSRAAGLTCEAKYNALVGGG